MSFESDRLDDIIDEGARDYNRAPEAPRADMWEKIQAARARNAAAPVLGVHRGEATRPSAPAERPTVIPMHSRRRPLWFAAGIAATLVLGVAIGRLSMRAGSGSSVDSIRGATSVAQSRAAQPETGGTVSPSTVVPPVRSGSESSGTQAVATVPRVRSASPDDSRRVDEERIGSQYRIASERAAERHAQDVALPYRLAATEHLAMTEALLVSLRADMKSGRRDTTVATWATNLLGTTRMLIDSPAGKDVQMKKLLEDLELVLAQIARLPAASGDSTDLELIDKAVKERHVLTRLRAIGPRT